MRLAPDRRRRSGKRCRSLPSSPLNPFLDLAPEVPYQPIQIGECIWLFLGADMLVIALARLVVKADDADAVDHERQPVLEGMTAARHRSRYAPDRDIGKTRFSD